MFMTDLILEDKNGNRLHMYFGDNYPAIVYIRQGGTIRVKRSSEPEKSLERHLRRFLL